MEDIQSQLLNNASPQLSLATAVDALVALRGVDYIAAVILLVELSDISRYHSPTQLIEYLGLVPSVHISGLALTAPKYG